MKKIPEQLQAMNVAIAEKMGWIEKDFGAYAAWYLNHKLADEAPPNYTSSLDACAEAVRSQSPEFQDRFQSTLNNVAFEAGRLFCQLEAIHWARAFLLTIDAKV